MGTIVVDGVSKIFGESRAGPEIRALDRVSLDIDDREIVCVVGPSGCGKTTLLNVIAGFETPTTGEVRIDGNLVAGAGPDRIVVFQSPSLFPWMTVRENVSFGPRKRGVPKRRALTDAAHYIEAVGLTRFADRYPYELSGGMRQRVQLARALVNQPEVLLMDEPFASLDFQTRLAMQELLLQLWHEIHPKIFFITHDVEEAVFLADRVYVISVAPGRIKQVIEVPFAKPRTIDLVTVPDFVAIKDRVLRLIREEFRASDRQALAGDGG
ncbi:MAG TPA: ABC transporter ATP-binding protein [Stellaceae bacterium]|nr:ABC transporter ATP-binding protein [Stellaceae bacterium]